MRQIQPRRRLRVQKRASGYRDRIVHILEGIDPTLIGIDKRIGVALDHLLNTTSELHGN